MATSNISDIDLDQLITDAINGDKESLELLRFSPWFTTLIDEISARMARKFRLDQQEIRDAVFDKVSDKIQDIKNPNNSPLTNCFAAWCERIAKSVCLNKARHNRVKKNHMEDLAARERINGTRKSTEGAPLPLQSRVANSPERILLEKEATRLGERLRSDVYLEVKKELDNSSPTDIRVVICWGAGMMNLKQISDATGISISTVQRHLTAWQKQILKKTVLQKIVNEDPKHRRAGAYEMIRNAVIGLTCAA